MDKKQIVFIEPKPTVNAYRIARSLKLTGNYETILVCFSEINREFYLNAYDKILILELSHRLNHELFATFINLFRKILSKKGRSLFREIRKMNPYIFQITGPDLFSLMAIFLLKKKIPKVYYANDIWGVEKRSFLFKKYGLKGEFQRICEKICFKMVDGILNKHDPRQFKLLEYKVHIPKISLSPDPLDEWIFPPKKKKKKEIHIVYGGCPFPSWNNDPIPFLKIVRIITSQNIHLHSYGQCTEERDNAPLINESKKNQFYHFHERVKPDVLNKEMSEYDYSIFPEFWTNSQMNENPGITKTEMSTKMTNYIEVGLPIITSKQNEYRFGIIKKNGIGIGINFEDLKNLREILKKINYKQLQKNMKKYQETNKLSKRIKEIELFYDKVIKIKNEKT